MRTILKSFLAALLLTVTSGSLHAQSDTSAYQPPTREEKARKFLLRYISIFDTATMAETKQASVRGIELVASTSKSDWLAQYHAAYCNAITGVQSTDTAIANSFLNKAEMYIRRADSIRKDESEIVLFQSMINGMRIRVNPSLGEKLGPGVMKGYDKARKLNPENPRVYLVLGESAMYTPAENGGGDKKAKELLNTALNKFSADKHEDPAWPQWGRERTESLLKELDKKK